MLRKYTTILLAAITWFALVLQFFLLLKIGDPQGSSPLRLTVNFFSYFTILSNLLVALCTSVAVFRPQGTAGAFLTSAGVRSAVAVYIFIVGLVYNLVLRQIWNPTGWQWVVDNLLHVVVPVLYIAWWYFITPGKQLTWKNIPAWLIFPAIYLLYSLVRGSLTGWYPYPFVDAATKGYKTVAINAALVLLAFMLTGAGVVALNRARRRDTER